MDKDDFLSAVVIFLLIAVLAICATALVCTGHEDYAWLPGLLTAYLLFG